MIGFSPLQFPKMRSLASVLPPPCWPQVSNSALSSLCHLLTISLLDAEVPLYNLKGCRGGFACTYPGSCSCPLFARTEHIKSHQEGCSHVCPILWSLESPGNRVSSVPGWFGQAKAALVPLPVYPKSYKKPVPVSRVAGVLQKPHTHVSRQEGSHKYAGGFSAFLTQTTVTRAFLNLILYYFTSFSPIFPRPTRISLKRGCQIRTVFLRWSQVSGRAIREKAAKFFLLWVEWDLACPHDNPELSLGAESNSRHSDRILFFLPQRYPNTQHCAIWLRLKSQESWAQRYPALVQSTADASDMRNGDTGVLPRGYPHLWPRRRSGPIMSPNPQPETFLSHMLDMDLPKNSTI